MKLRVVPPDPEWPAGYAAEAGSIRRALGAMVRSIHHIGSTAVPGIFAKPIIDRLLEVTDLAELDAQATAMEELEYEAMGEFGIPGRRYFRKDSAAGVRTHHVHAFAASDPEIERHLAFRDYLTAHPAVARAYSDLKRKLAATRPDDWDAYINGKHPFIKRHETDAITWWRSRHGSPPPTRGNGGL